MNNQADDPKGEENEKPPSGSLLKAAWMYVLAEPAKAAGLAYFWLTAIGFARIFGNTMWFGINAVDLASPSDFLLAGLRDPIVVGVAAVTGLILYSMWGKALRSRRWRLALGPAVLLFLFVAVVGSAFYRFSMVAGALRNSSWAPVPMAVTLDDQQGGEAIILPDLRLVSTTADYFIFYRDSGRTIVVKRDTVKRMEFKTP